MRFASLLYLAFFSLALEHFDATQKIVRKYDYLDAKGIYDLSLELAKKYPEFVKVESAQDLFKIKESGSEDDCVFDTEARANNRNGCMNYILTIEDKVRNREGSEQRNNLPEILLSGALHGNERVGPTVVMEFAALLLDAANCESYPRIHTPGAASPGILKEQYNSQLQRSQSCRRHLKKRGIGDDNRRWLSRLVATRRIVIVPTANALGFYREEMSEDGKDPEHDFPFDLTGNQTCMHTAAARTLNELFKQSMFQIALNFHAGVMGIGYPWGAPIYHKSMSPDATAQMQIADAMSSYAGATFGAGKMSVGKINEVASITRGSMEDWSYGGRWAQHEPVMECDVPKKYKTKSYPTDESNRALAFYVGTSSMKKPDKEKLGTDEYLFVTPKDKMSGFIARNLRTALVATDVAEPYVVIRNVEKIKIEDDIVPLRPITPRSCIGTKSFQVPIEKEIVLEWEVGGAFSVEETMLVYGKWSDFPDDVDGINQPISLIPLLTNKNSMQGQSDLKVAYGGSGHAKWGKESTVFSVKLPLNDFSAGDSIAIMAVAIVDKLWAANPDVDIKPPNLPQQSHLVNKRINPNWKKTIGTKKIVGQTHWFSIPVTIEMKPTGNKVKETSSRLPMTHVVTKMRERVYEKVDEIEDEVEGAIFTPIFASIFVAALIFASGLVICKNRRSSSQSYYETETVKLNESEYSDLQLT